MSLRSFVRTIDTGAETRIPVAGNVVFVRSTSVADAEVLVSAVAQAPGRNAKTLAIRSPLAARQKLKFDPDSFDDLTIRNEGAAPVTVVVVAGFGDVDAPASSLSISGTVAVAEAASTLINDNAPVTAADAAETALIGANPLRRRLRVGSAALNAGPVYIRAATGGNAIAELAAGTWQHFDTLQALWVRNDSGAAADLYLCEEE
jgi:hypothetical protein